MYQYDVLSKAVEGLRSRGYTEDFNLEKHCLICNGEKYYAEDCQITEVHRFEGESDPGDEAVVYAIESKNGVKGILVNGYGYQSNPMSDAIASKLKITHH
jgi:hypothetical protein